MKIIIAGAYAIGTHLAKLLSRNDQDIVLIDEDEERLNNISNDYDLMTIHSSPSSIQTLKTPACNTPTCSSESRLTRI